MESRVSDGEGSFPLLDQLSLRLGFSAKTCISFGKCTLPATLPPCHPAEIHPTWDLASDAHKNRISFPLFRGFTHACFFSGGLGWFGSYNASGFTHFSTPIHPLFSAKTNSERTGAHRLAPAVGPEGRSAATLRRAARRRRSARSPPRRSTSSAHRPAWSAGESCRPGAVLGPPS